MKEAEMTTFQRAIIDEVRQLGRELKKDIDFTLTDIVFKNKAVTIKCTAKAQRNELMKYFEEYHFVNSVWAISGERLDDVWSYKIRISVKHIYWDWGYTEEDTIKDWLEFMEQNKIQTIDDFVQLTLPMIQNMNRFTKSLPFKKRQPYYAIKSNYIKLLFDNGYITSVTRHISHKADWLYLFYYKNRDISFHLRCQQVDWLPLKREDYWLEPKVFFGNSYEPSEIDTTFKEYMKILRLIQVEFFWVHAQVS